MPTVELPLGIEITPLIAAYIPIIVFVTEAIMKATPLTFDKARFGQLVSLGTAIIVSAIDGTASGLGISAIVIRGLAFAVIANYGYGAFKTVSAGVNNRREE